MRTREKLTLVGNDLNLIVDSLHWLLIDNDCSFNNEFSIRYIGTEAPQAEMILTYKDDSLKELEVTDIIPLGKEELSVEEYNHILDLFYEEVIKPNMEKKSCRKMIEPIIDQSNLLYLISEESLNKLKSFLNHFDKRHFLISSLDKKMWFDFICQTVDDNQTFDYDTLYLLLQDEDYWGKDVSCGKEQADRLAREYVDYVCLLQYYKKTRKVD